MEIALKIHGVSITKDANKTLEKDLVLTTQTIKVNKKDQVVNREVTISGNTCNFALQNIQFTKKMYQPTEVSAEISVGSMFRKTRKVSGSVPMQTQLHSR